MREKTEMKISLRELEQVTNFLLKYLKSCGKTEFALKDDYYWVIPSEERYNPLADPKTFTMGQLYDDWGELKSILSKKNEPVAYALVWLASILEYIGERTPC